MALANASLLPMSHLTPKTLLGGGGEERESLAQLYAVQIASFIARSNSDERRTLVLGLGLQKLRPEREAFFDVLELIQKVL
jgi:proteasome assembly chaperone 3